MTTTIRLIGAFCLALCLALVPTSEDALAQGKGKGGGKPAKDPPPPAFCASVATPTDFLDPTTLQAPDDSTHMFGRPLAGAQILETGGDIVLAVGARPNHLFIYLLDPAAGSNVIAMGQPYLTILLADIPRKLAVADFNGDDVPDFVVSGFGPVEVLMSSLDSNSVLSSYDSITLPFTGKVSVAATDSYVAVGVRDADGKRKPGKVFIYEYQPAADDFSPVLELTGTVNGDWFGEAVAFGDVLGDAGLDLIVGATGVDVAKKIANVGEMWVFDDVLKGGQGCSTHPGPGGCLLIQGGALHEERFAWQVAVAGNNVVAATKWSNPERRAQVYDNLPFSNITLNPGSSLFSG